MPPGILRETSSGTAACRDCGQEVGVSAVVCPACGAPRPAVQDFKGEGFEYKSTALWMGYPVVHIAFGSDARGKARQARGLIAIGLNAVGGVAVGLNTVGFLSVGINAAGVFALGLNAVGALAACGLVAVAPWAYGLVGVGWKAGGVSPIGVHVP